MIQFFDFHGRLDTIGTVGLDGQTITGLDVWRQIVPVLIALIGVLIIAILAKYGVKANVIIGIVASTVLYYIFMWELPDFDLSAIGQTFKDFGEVGFLGLFNGDAWDAAFNSSYIGGAFSAVMLIIVFCLVDMFDTVGTIYGTASQADMLDENGDPININKSMMCDSIGTVAGSILGTSTCTTFVESAAGVAAGVLATMALGLPGKENKSSVVNGFICLTALFAFLTYIVFMYI